MARCPEHRAASSGFFWQGLLILLPVVVLAVIGLVSIQKDKSMAEREAAERAQALADESAESIWAALAGTSGLGREFAFQVGATGELVFPPPTPLLPTPEPFPTDELNPEQSRLWEIVSSSSDDATNVVACREFLATQPSERFEAATRFHLARLLAGRGEQAEARKLLAAIASDSPAAVGGTGLPLGPLARLKAIELASAGERHGELLTLCSLALSNPSPVTPFLLGRAAELEKSSATVQACRAEWDRHELLRHLHSAASKRWRLTGSNTSAMLPRFTWFTTEDVAMEKSGEASSVLWLATHAETNSAGGLFVCRPTLDQRILPPGFGPLEGSVRPARIRPGGQMNLLHGPWSFTNSTPDPLPVAVSAVQKRLPPYFGLTLNIAGRALIASNDLPAVNWVRDKKGGGGRYWKFIPGQLPPPALATVSKLDEGVEVLRIGIHLVGPEMLYARQRSRSRLFGLLIAASAAAACGGFVAARSAYQRQRQLSEMKSNFVSSVSHELRAPIASVRLMAENLERGKVADAEKQRDYFRFITQECRRLGSLIENVLDFARIEQGRKQYDFEPTDIEALVAQTVKLMEPAAAEKNVKLHIEAVSRSAGLRPGEWNQAEHAGPEAGAPLLDAPAIQQALVNLLDNAIKHSPAGATVTVGLAPPTSPPASDDSYVSRFTLYVQDSGPGIPREEHEKIFQRFYRRGSEMRRETPGVGIGLSIVKHIVEAHGGRVVVDSEPGKGSRFGIELPMKQQEHKQ